MNSITHVPALVVPWSDKTLLLLLLLNYKTNTNGVWNIHKIFLCWHTTSTLPSGEAQYIKNANQTVRSICFRDTLHLSKQSFHSVFSIKYYYRWCTIFSLLFLKRDYFTDNAALNNLQSHTGFSESWGNTEALYVRFSKLFRWFRDDNSDWELLFTFLL